MTLKINILYLLYYLLIINILSAFIFYSDKQKAINKRQRIPEVKLHLLELMGGVFIILPMLYLERHKNRKPSYFVLTYLIFLGWLISFILVFR